MGDFSAGGQSVGRSIKIGRRLLGQNDLKYPYAILSSIIALPIGTDFTDSLERIQ